MQGYDNTSYGEAFADVYDDWYSDIGDVDAAVEALAQLAQDAGSLPIVELGVGTGRLAIPLAQRVHPTGRWYWVALTYDGQRMTHYIDGEQELTAQVAFGPMGPGQTSLGVRQNKVYWFKGGISTLRFHPTALTPPQLQRAPQP